MARRGRPRKLHTRRYANGSVVRNGVMTATPELLARRLAMVGTGGDAVMSTCALDIMAARRIIDADTHQAAAWFASLARIVLGRPHARSSLDDTWGREPSDAALRWGAVGYAFIAETLDAPERGELLELVHFQLMPNWLIRTINNGTALRAGDIAARARSLRALERLAYVYSRWRGAGLPAGGEPRLPAAAE